MCWHRQKIRQHWPGPLAHRATHPDAPDEAQRNWSQPHHQIVAAVDWRVLQLPALGREVNGHSHRIFCSLHLAVLKYESSVDLRVRAGSCDCEIRVTEQRHSSRPRPGMAGPVLNHCIIECSADACPCSLLTKNVILCECTFSPWPRAGSCDDRR